MGNGTLVIYTQFLKYFHIARKFNSGQISFKRVDFIPKVVHRQ